MGRRKAAICLWGVLSGIVLRGGESQPQACGTDTCKGKDLTEGRSPTKETSAGHVGLDNTSQPHCGQQPLDLVTGNCEDPRGSESNRRTGCGKTARPGLCGGLRVTGVPTARYAGTL